MKPLEGVRILTIEQFGAGPYGSLFLSDLGAEVIKIENAATEGDTGRHVGPHFLGENDSEYFQTFGSNKKSITLDLKSDEGQAGVPPAGRDGRCGHEQSARRPAGRSSASTTRL